MHSVCLGLQEITSPRDLLRFLFPHLSFLVSFGVCFETKKRVRRSCTVEVSEAKKIEFERGFLDCLLGAIYGCCASETETAIGFKFTKKPPMRVISSTIFSFSISPDFYHYDYISDDDDDYSGSDVNMIGVFNSDMDDHEVSTTPRLHVHEPSIEYDHLPHNQVVVDDDDDQFYSAQTDFISSP